jgi:hypothetical protein
MSQHLPTGEFDWLNDEEISNLDITQITDDSEEGYILEVDLNYPKELYDLHDDYPPAPEKIKVESEMLSPYCQRLSEDLNLGSVAVPKLVPNLNDKTNYIVHYRYLKLYLSLGMEVTRIQQSLVFQQSPWLKTYIDFISTQKERKKKARRE